MIKKSTKLFLLMLLNIIFLNGCWDAREINEIGLVTAVGIDIGEDTNRYLVTVQIANPSADVSSSSSNNIKQAEWIVTGEGESLFDATRKLVEISSRRIMWAHNNVIIIGESLAKRGIIPVVDFFTHNPELRMKASVVVSKGDAKKYVAAKAGFESPSGLSFILLEGYRALHAESVESHMLKVSSALKNEYTNLLISEISLKNAIIASKESDSKQSTSETISLSGAAIFKKDKMLGWLSPEETRGVSWILNETSNTVVTVIDPEHGNKSVSVETSGVKAKFKTEVTNGIPKVWINVSGIGDIVEEDGSTKKSMSEVKQNTAKLIDQKIKDEIKNSLMVVQRKYMVDVLGFAAIVHIQNDREWHNGLKDNWKEIFPEIPVSVSVNININSSKLNQEPYSIY